MTWINSENLIADILKPCFPHATNIKVLENLTLDDLPNFTSDIQQLTIEYEEDRQTRRKHLILKNPEHCPAQAMFVKANFYDREVSMYEELASRINELLGHRILPVHYGIVNSQILVLENLTAQGFRRVERDQFFDPEQCYPILRTLAKFHAASHRIHQQHPHLLDNPNVIRFRSVAIRRPMIDSWEPVLCEVLRRNESAHLVPKLRAAMRFLRDDEVGLNSKIHRGNFKFVVLNHFDYRKENMLFKFDDGGRFKDMKILDFQTVMWSSPVIDVFYFLVHSVQPHVLDQYFEQLIDSYLDSLEEALHRLNCADTYAKADLMADLKSLKVVLFFIVVCFCVYLAATDTKKCKDMFAVEDEKKRPSFDGFLDDKLFVQLISGWLKYLEKLDAYDESTGGSRRNSTKDS